MPYRHALPYHQALVRHLKQHVATAWQHVASDRFQVDTEDRARLDLLRTTYAMQRNSHPDLYALVDAVATELALDVPVELYQGEAEDRMNAALLFHPSTARLVFYGPLLERLDPDEQRALVAHELSHHRLWTLDDGDYLVAVQVLQLLANLNGGSAIHALRLFQLHTEVFCDRSALQLLPVDPIIRTLLKVRTNFPDVVASDFLAQSEELLAKEGGGSRGWSHPEAHLRALAVARFAADPASDVWEMLQGPLQLEELDLVRRYELHLDTRALVGHLLEPEWFRTDATRGQMRLMFDDEDVPAFAPWAIDPAVHTARWGTTVQDYMVSLLLDFTASDPSLDQLPLQRCHQVAEWLGLTKRFEKAVNKKLKIRQKDIAAAASTRDVDLDSATLEAV